MKPLQLGLLTLTSATAAVIAAASSSSSPDHHAGAAPIPPPAPAPVRSDSRFDQPQQQQQRPLMGNRRIQMPPGVETDFASDSGHMDQAQSQSQPQQSQSASDTADAHTKVQRAVPLSDILGTNRAITSFSSFSRLDSSTSSLLGDLTTNTTVLAPLNSAIDALPRKPWEQPSDYHHGSEGSGSQQETDGGGGGDGQDRANRNIQRFVEAHLVKSSPWRKGEKVMTVAGKEVWWEEKEDGGKVIMPDGVDVDKVASQVANGELVRFCESPTNSL